MAIIQPSERRTKKGKLCIGTIWAVLLLGIPIILFPSVWMFLSSFKPSAEIMSVPPTFIPETVTFSGYDAVLKFADMGKNFLNTLYCIVFILILQVGSSSMAAYSLSKLNPVGKKGLMLFFMATMMISSQALVFPLYLMMSDFPLIHVNLLGSKWAYILASSAWAWSLMLFRGFFDNIPSDLFEASKIDGAGQVRTFVSIALPLAKPAFLLNILNTCVAVYNDFFIPLMLMPDENNWTVMVRLFITQRSSNIELNGIYAMLLMVTLPIIILYLFVQKHLVDGIATSGMKL